MFFSDIQPWLSFPLPILHPMGGGVWGATTAGTFSASIGTFAPRHRPLTRLPPRHTRRLRSDPPSAINYRMQAYRRYRMKRARQRASGTRPSVRYTTRSEHAKRRPRKNGRFIPNATQT